MIEPTISYQGVTYAPIQPQENTPLIEVVAKSPIEEQQTKSKSNKIGLQILGAFLAIGEVTGFGCLVASPFVWNADLAIGGGIAFLVCGCFSIPVSIAGCKTKKNK